MKRNILALALGELFLMSITPVLLMVFPSNQNFLTSGTTLTIIILIASAITGYIARKKGWLYGALLILLSYILTAIVIAVPIVYNVLEAQSRNIPVSGDTKLLPQFILNIVIIIVIPAMLLGAAGGHIGELIYRRRP